MKNYEIMAIVQNSLDTKAAEKFCQEALLGRIKKSGGKVTFEDFWGERGFAYKIKKMTWGYYFVARFELDGAALSEIKNELNIENNLLRFIITSVDKNTTPSRKYSDMKAEYEAQEKALVTEKEEKTNHKKANVKPSKLSTVSVKTESIDAPKKDAVDKKLDDIVSQSAQAL